MRQIAFVRHGKSTKRGDDSAGLAEKGIQRIQKTAEKLKDFGATKVFTSHLPRAQQSANIIASKLGLPVAVLDQLKEVKGNEAIEEGTKRMEDAYNSIKSSSDGNVIVVSHGIAMKLLIDKLWGKSGEIKRGRMKVMDMK